MSCPPPLQVAAAEWMFEHARPVQCWVEGLGWQSHPSPFLEVGLWIRRETVVAGYDVNATNHTVSFCTRIAHNMSS